MQEQESGFKSPMNILVFSLDPCLYMYSFKYTCATYNIHVRYILLGETPEKI